MSRPATPTAVLETRGSFLQTPRLKNTHVEPFDTRPLGEPPAWMSEAEKVNWHEIADELLPGVAKKSDRRAFAMLVALDTRFKQGLLNKAADRTSLISLYARFAMSPTDRCKVAVEAPAKNDLDSFINS